MLVKKNRIIQGMENYNDCGITHKWEGCVQINVGLFGINSETVGRRLIDESPLRNVFFRLLKSFK